MNNLWQNYKKILFDKFDFVEDPMDMLWEGKRNTSLTAKIYRNKYFIKAREVEIYNEKSCIYNNIIYPKTGGDLCTDCGWGSNLPCFGMDLMGFGENKVIIVFDFQHPTEKFKFEVPGLPKPTEDYRFFEKGNHFSENIIVRKCNADEVDQYLDIFDNYLEVYKNMVEVAKPDGEDTSVYADFDAYMTRLDPVGGYLKGIFGEERAEQLVKSFLFCYNK